MSNPGLNASATQPSPVLELRNVTVPGRQHPRLEGIHLRLEAGERVALLGASGAGKSTLLAVANGLLQPAQGEVHWSGERRARSARARRRQQARIGTLWQDLRLIEELSVQQNLNCGRLASWGWPRALLNLLLPLESEACAQALRQVDLDPVLLSLHRPDLLQGFDRVIGLRQGRICWDRPVAQLQTSDLEALYAGIAEPSLAR